jgi:hypothetical protein
MPFRRHLCSQHLLPTVWRAAGDTSERNTMGCEADAHILPIVNEFRTGVRVQRSSCSSPRVRYA